MAYDGDLPVDGDLARAIFGDIDFANLPVGVRSTVAGIIGARAGKSYVLVGLRLVHGMLLRDLSPLRPSQEAAATVVAPNDRQRREVAAYAYGILRSRPELRERVRIPKGAPEDQVPSSFGIWREDFGRFVAFNAAVSSAGGASLRGYWHTDVIYDEACFFRDASYKVNDEELYKAGVARVILGGQAILMSTAFMESGLLYTLHRKNMGKPETALAAHAPTLLLHDTPYTRDLVARERARDPENARREYDGVFMTTGTTVFFDGPSIDTAVTDEPFTPQAGDIVFAGGDFAFRGDSSALVLVAMRGHMLHVFDGVEERPEGGKPLKPSATVAAFAACIKGRCSYLMADQHYREAIAEHLEQHGLDYAAAPMQPADSYVRARMLLREGRVRIHGLPFRERLLQQMREVHGKPTSGGGMSIVHPRWATGGHGDLVAALVLALWQVSGDEVAAQKPAAGTAEWEEAQRDARRQAYLEAKDRPWWQVPSDDRGEGAWWRR